MAQWSLFVFKKNVTKNHWNPTSCFDKQKAKKVLRWEWAVQKRGRSFPSFILPWPHAVNGYHQIPLQKKKCSQYWTIKPSFPETQADESVERYKDIAVTGRIVLSRDLSSCQILNSADDKWPIVISIFRPPWVATKLAGWSCGLFIFLE